MEIADTLQGASAETLETVRSFVILGNTLDQILLSLLFIVIGWAVARILTFFLSRFAASWAKTTETELDDFAVKVLRSMTTFVVLVLAFSYATKVLTLTDEIDLFIQKLVIIFLSVKITASLLRIFDFAMNRYLVPYANKTEILDATIVPTLNRIVKMIIWAIVALLIVSNLGYNISSLLAGLGIGGLAIALAAQEALSNFFGSISIFADKTFKVGDFIKAGSIQGTVKSVGLRSTRLETTEGTEMIVPNSNLSSEIIENLSLRPTRRIDLTMNVAYTTSNSKMKEAMKILKDLIAANKSTEKHCRVHFQAFDESGLNLLLTYWVKDIDFEKGQKIQNEVNLKIKSEFEKAKIEMAYPTRTVYMKQ